MAPGNNFKEKVNNALDDLDEPPAEIQAFGDLEEDDNYAEEMADLIHRIGKIDEQSNKMPVRSSDPASPSDGEFWIVDSS